MLPSNGDGSARIKYLDNGSIEIVTGNVQRLVVSNNGVVVTGDLAASGGFVRSFNYFRNRVLQSSTPVMTASMMDFSGTAALGNGTRVVYLGIPMTKAGSVVAVALYTGDATVKSGSLSGTVLIGGTPTAATVGIHSGTVATNSFTKDTYTFTAGQVLQVQLTASATYLTDTDPTSGSWMAVVDVEF
jgi:hypothetical protein